MVRGDMGYSVVFCFCTPYSGMLFVIMGLCLVNLEFLTPGYPMKATKNNKIIDNMTNRN